MSKQVNIGVNDIKVESGKKLIPLGDIAIWVNHGTQNIPPRPAFEEGTDKAIRDNEKITTAYLQNMFVQSQSPNVHKDQLDRLEYNYLKRMGQAAVKEVKSIIELGSTAPNAPATIKKKGFDHPWFHRGTMLKNVNYQIEEIES